MTSALLESWPVKRALQGPLRVSYHLWMSSPLWIPCIWHQCDIIRQHFLRANCMKRKCSNKGLGVKSPLLTVYEAQLLMKPGTMTQRAAEIGLTFTYWMAKAPWRMPNVRKAPKCSDIRIALNPTTGMLAAFKSNVSDLLYFTTGCQMNSKH